MQDQLEKAISGLTHGMSERDLRQLMYVVCLFELQEGHVLIRQGAHTESMCIVYSGALEVKVEIDDKMVYLPEVGPGQWVGEINLLDPGRASAHVSVKGPTKVLEFSYSALNEYRDKHPEGALRLLNALSLDLAGRLHQTTNGVLRRRGDRIVLDPPAKPQQKGWSDLLVKLFQRGGQA